MLSIASTGHLQFGVGGTIRSGKRIPSSIRTFCPHCYDKVAFQLPSQMQASNELVIAGSARCPSCNEVTAFALFYETSQENVDPVDVAMFPSPGDSIQPMVVPASVSERIARAIREAETALRTGLYSAALSSAGRAFEGIMKEAMGDQCNSSTLANLIEKFVNSESATRPIERLATAIRTGRNAGAHFDEVLEPDQETAELILELLRYFISYFVLFEEKSEALSLRLNARSK